MPVHIRDSRTLLCNVCEWCFIFFFISKTNEKRRQRALYSDKARYFQPITTLVRMLQMI